MVVRFICGRAAAAAAAAVITARSDRSSGTASLQPEPPCRAGRPRGRAVNNSACSGGELRRRYNKNKRVVPVVISRRAASVDQLMRFTIAVI